MSLACEPPGSAAAPRVVLARLAGGLDRRALLALWTADAGFIALHIAHRLWWPERVAWSLAEDRGHAEIYQYLKTLLVAALLLQAARLRREALLALWGGLFAYVALDDAASLHERAGLWLASRPGFLPGRGKQASDVGELLVLAGVSGAFVAAGLLLWRRGRLRWSAHGSELLALMVPLLLCGVVVDFVHALVLGQQRFRGLYLLEDGGELLAMSLIAAWAARLVRRTAPRPLTAPA